MMRMNACRVVEGAANLDGGFGYMLPPGSNPMNFGLCRKGAGTSRRAARTLHSISAKARGINKLPGT